MTTGIVKKDVKRWLRGQRAAGRLVARERALTLATLTPQESLRIYLDLKAASPQDADSGPSPLITAVRRVLDRYAGRERPEG
ncbi:MAG: hypothetical protein NTU88_00820 [Armatimonadetes bacterium]|nr:hypothetical protein [Armatimonadota bacterium]